jgi:hypothetical protein
VRVSLQLDGWRPTSRQVGQLLDAFIVSDPQAGSSSFGWMKVTTPPGNEWSFERYEDFHEELDADDYEAFTLFVGGPPVSMRVSFFGTWTAFEAELPSRSALEGLVAVVRHLATS